MARRRKTQWACTRQSKGVKCNTLNPIRAQKCSACGKAKPRPAPKKHMAGLNYDYEHYKEINGGEHCGICFTTVSELKNPQKKFARDHDHSAIGLGNPRGLLCTRCNMRLSYQMTAEWLEAAAAYVRRADERIQAWTQEAA